MEFSRQEYWRGLQFPSPEDLPELGIEPGSPELQADSLPSEPWGETPYLQHFIIKDLGFYEFSFSNLFKGRFVSFKTSHLH